MKLIYLLIQISKYVFIYAKKSYIFYLLEKLAYK